MVSKSKYLEQYTIQETIKDDFRDMLSRIIMHSATRNAYNTMEERSLTDALKAYDSVKNYLVFIQIALNRIEDLFDFNKQHELFIESDAFNEAYTAIKRDAQINRQILTNFIISRTIEDDDVKKVCDIITFYSKAGSNRYEDLGIRYKTFWYMLDTAGIFNKLNECDALQDRKLQALGNLSVDDYNKKSLAVICHDPEALPEQTRLERAVDAIIDKLFDANLIKKSSRLNTLFVPCNAFQNSIMHMREKYKDNIKQGGIYGAYLKEQSISDKTRLAMDYAFIAQGFLEDRDISINDNQIEDCFGIAVIGPSLYYHRNNFDIFTSASLEAAITSTFMQTKGIIICYCNTRFNGIRSMNIMHKLSANCLLLDDVILDKNGYEHLLVLATVKNAPLSSHKTKVLQQTEFMSYYGDTEPEGNAMPQTLKKHIEINAYCSDLIALSLFGDNKSKINYIDNYDMRLLSLSIKRGQITSLKSKMIWSCVGQEADTQFVSIVCDQIFKSDIKTFSSKFNPFKIDNGDNDKIQPLLPFSDGQLGMVLASGALDGVIEEHDATDSHGNPIKHVIRGQIITDTKQENDEQELNGDSILDIRQIQSQAVVLSLYDGSGTLRGLKV